MSRRLTAAAALAALGAAVLPAVPAFASAASSATLTVGQAVYPGADRSFTLRVTNNEAPVTGKAINAIRINFPVEEANIGLGSTAGSALGFTGTKTDLGSTEFITYRGGNLPPGAFLDITFPALVGSPQARDLFGDFRVQVSSDDFRTNKSASVPSGGTLTSEVQILEILQSGLKPVAPTNTENTKGVTDRTGTAGQTVTYATTVKSYAATDVDITAALASTTEGGGSAPLRVPAGGVAQAMIPVTLGSASADRKAVFTASAAKADADAPTKTDTFTVQAPAALNYVNVKPNHTKSGAGSAKDFTVNVNKTGTPALDLTQSTLSFATDDNKATAEEKPTFGPNANSRVLTYKFTEVKGVDGTHGAKVTSVATDDNLASYNLTDTDLGTIVIDNLAPVVSTVLTLPKDADGDEQVATKNRDTLTVSGTITNATDVVPETLKVVLQPDAGDPVTVPVTLSGSGDKRTYTGSVATTWDPKATTVKAKTEITDLAGNIGGRESGSSLIDNASPVLGPDDGVIVEPTKITVGFNDKTGVAGGCDPNAWLLDGTPGRVKEVRNADGSLCAGLGDGARVLILNSPLAVDATPSVTYDLLPRGVTTRPAKDGAGNDALRQTINTITNLTPAAPRLVRLDRRNGTPTAAFEAAFQDSDKTYYTNVAGTDALRLTVGGIRENYTLEVLEAGQIVAFKKFTAPVGPLASDYNGDVLVPLKQQPSSAFVVRFVSGVGNVGATTPFTVVLDQVAPALGTAKIGPGTDGGSSVTVPFTDNIVVGTDFSDDWFVSETVQTETGTKRRTVNANSVSGSGQTSRALQVTLRDPSRFDGVDYFLQSPSGVRYEDRAGNPLADTLKLGG